MLKFLKRLVSRFFGKKKQVYVEWVPLSEIKTESTLDAYIEQVRALPPNTNRT